MKSEVVIRELKENDVDSASDLLLRLKKLNGEFDSIFNVAEGAAKEAAENLRSMIREKDTHLAYIAEKDSKVIGIIAVNLVHRCYYEPEVEARIVEFYVMPASRRTGAGKLLVDRAYEELRKKGIKLVTAEFPALNPIALNFYKDLGFREIVGVYGKLL